MRLYGEIVPSFSEGIIDRTGAQTKLYLPCTMISSVDLAHYGASCAKDGVSVDCGIILDKTLVNLFDFKCICPRMLVSFATGA